LEDVARSAGVSKGTVYLYFENKEALFRAVVAEEVLPQIARVEGLVDAYTGDMAELLRQLVEQWWQTVGETPLSGIPKLMMAEASNFPELAHFYVDNVVCRVRRILVRVVKRGIDEGEFRPCDSAYVARALLAPLVFAVTWRRSLEPFDSDPYDARTFLEVQLDLALNGLTRVSDDAATPRRPGAAH
jgi:AcrR family transcriptional regulator